MAGQGMRMALKGATPSARARLKYILRQGLYAVGREGRRTDLAVHDSGNLPSWAGGNPIVFWQAVDQFERKGGRRCVELELNLAPELTLDQQAAVIESYVQHLLGAERLPYTWAIHDADTGNPHVHLMFQERGLDGIDRPDAQAWFKQAAPRGKDPARGGARKSRAITGAAWMLAARVAWAEAVNDGLLAAGHEPRFDHRSKEAQLDAALRAGNLRRAAELTTLTERHEGYAVHGMRQRVDSGELEWDDVPAYAQQIIKQNDLARAYNCCLRDRVRLMTDVELREYLAPELDELRDRLEQESHSAHVAAWELHELVADEQAVQANALRMLEYRQELERSDELRELVAGEQLTHLDELLAIEVAQAHEIALVENELFDPPVEALAEEAERAAALPVLGSDELATMLPRLREQYAKLVPACSAGGRGRGAKAAEQERLRREREQAEQELDHQGFDWAAFDAAEARYDAQTPETNCYGGDEGLGDELWKQDQPEPQEQLDDSSDEPASPRGRGPRLG